MAEFKRLSDVEVVAEPIESANILIEEDGVIKKAPKIAVGGNNKWDAVIEANWAYGENARFIQGDFSTIYNKIMIEREVPKIKIITISDSYGLNYSVSSSNYAVYFEKEDCIQITYRSEAGEDHFHLLSIYRDNTFSDSKPR